MLGIELSELMRSGENSGVEFKSDDVHTEGLAKVISAFLNFEGGRILLGVEDSGEVRGLSRKPKEAEEWVMQVCRDCIQPPIIPYWETMPWGESSMVGVITLPADSPDKPYKAKRGSSWFTFMRAGTLSHEATREEEARLYQSSGLMRYDLRPVIGSTLADLDRRRLRNYFRDKRKQEIPADDNTAEWEILLINTDIMLEDRGRIMPTVAGMLLFGKSPNRFLPQAGISATAFQGEEKDYDARERGVLRGPIVPFLNETGELQESGLIEQAIDFVKRNIKIASRIDEGGRRIDRWDYPLETIREAAVNAIVHRDYTITVKDIELYIFSNRLEVLSPGRLPNTVTVEKMKRGYRASRNELIKDVMRDYNYIEATGMGVPRKIIKGMLEHNGKEPDLIEEETQFLLRLWK